jgi:hypothetical protein
MKKFAFYVLLVGFWVLSNITTGFTNPKIYDNGVPDLQNAYMSDFGWPLQRGDNFVLTSGSNVITDIHWWGVYYPSGLSEQDNFTIRIFNFENSGGPDADFFYENIVGNVNRTDTGSIIAGSLKMYEYAVDIQPLTLTPGDSYLLSIINNAGTSGIYWNWASISDGPSYFRDLDGTSWGYYQAVGMAFNLTGPTEPIPEPTTIVLLGSGLIGLAGYGRKTFFRK